MRKYCLICVVNLFCAASLEPDPDRNVTCGVDFSRTTPFYRRVADIKDYPWLGTLYYPLKGARVTTVVVLVTRQLVIGSSTEIDKIPKDHFRARARVVLGGSCSLGVGVRDYSYHPEFEDRTYSSLALVQLDVDEVAFELFPICGPPTHFVDVRIYAFTLNEDCEKPIVTIYEMTYVDMEQCRQFYRRSGLDVSSLWPTHVTCARAFNHSGECVWRSGAALATKLGNQWHLLGYGVFGPGCSAPARFLDYGMYVRWVKTSVARVGSPAVTRLGPAHLILRRKNSNLQRFGPCDLEEVRSELYTDTVTYVESVKWGQRTRTIRYNITIGDTVEYSCVTFKVYHKTYSRRPTPRLRLKRWCSKPHAMCFGFGMISIDFYVEIRFVGTITFKMAAYGKQAMIIDAKVSTVFANRGREKPTFTSPVDAIPPEFYWD